MSDSLEGRSGLRYALPVRSIVRLAAEDAPAIRVLVVDDEEDMRDLVRMTLELAAGIEVVGEAVDATDAARHWQSVRPDVLVVDHRLPGTTGLELAAWILQEDPDARILLFSASLDAATVAQATDAGIRSCVSKDRLRELPVLVREHAVPRRDLVPIVPIVPDGALARLTSPPPAR